MSFNLYPFFFSNYDESKRAQTFAVPQRSAWYAFSKNLFLCNEEQRITNRFYEQNQTTLKTKRRNEDCESFLKNNISFTYKVS